MYNVKAVHEYWQHAWRLEALMAFTPDQAKNFWRVISSAECLQGKLEDQKSLEILLAQGSSMVIAPCYLSNGSAVCIPYLLNVELDATGAFKPMLPTAMPIIPRSLLEPTEMLSISLGAEQCMDDYITLQPPPWIEAPAQLTWDQQLTYAQQLMLEVAGTKWTSMMQELRYELQDSALIFPLAVLGTPQLMDIKLLTNKSKVELIAADRNSGKSTYAKSKITEGWIEAAVKQAPPPEYVWLQHGQPIRYASIFDCTQIANMTLNNTELAVTKSKVHKELTQLFNAYIKGKQVARNWQELSKKIADRYADKGGIQSRIQQLQLHLKEAHARFRHMQVLQSIWNRQSEMITTWTKFLDVFSSLKKSRLRRLYVFFKQNFPSESVQGLSQEQMNSIIVDKLNRSRNSERFIADALHQAESDLNQLTLVSDKLLQWGNTQDASLIETKDVLPLLHEKLLLKLVVAAACYWQLDFAITNDRDQFLSKIPRNIALLIVEHAEYISPMRAAELLAISQRAIIIGNYNPVSAPRFPVQIDYELCKHFRLVDCDADYEDLQFDGIAAALGNMWNLAAQGKEADQTLIPYVNVTRSYEFKNVIGVADDYLGSKINKSEVTALLKWMYKNNPSINEIAIFTSFAGQAHYIREQLKLTKYALVPVMLLHKPALNKFKICLFSPVYTAADPGPYNFDRGVEMLDNLVANAEQQLIVFGDQSIFKPELHSAAGKFAKQFIATQDSPINESEVNCV